MRLPTMREELLRAAYELGLSGIQFRALDEQEGNSVLLQIEARFVENQGRRWWWEDFRRFYPVKSSQFADGRGWEHLPAIIPSETTMAWFVVESSSEFVLCEGTPDAIQAVIGECWAFEYYIVSKALDWLIGESHHNVVYAVGAAVVDRLPPSQVS